MAATGLPIPRNDNVLAQAPAPVSIDLASDWQRIAAAGAQIASEGEQTAKLAIHQQQVGYTASQDVAAERKKIEVFNQVRDDPAILNKPAAFDTAWQAHTEATLAAAEPWAVPHLRKVLGHHGNTAYSTLLNEDHAKNSAIAKDNWSALADVAGNGVLSAATAGTLNTPDGQAKIAKLEAVYGAGVSSRFLSQEEATRRVEVIKSQGTVYASREWVKSRWEEGGVLKANAAIDDIVRNENLQLSPEQRFGLASRLKADVHAWEAERHASLTDAKASASKLLEARTANVNIPLEVIDGAVDRLRKYGGTAEAASFLSDMKHAEELQFLGRVPTADAAKWIGNYRASLGFAVPPQPIKAAIDEAAAATGTSAAYLTRVAGKESSFDANARPIDPATGKPTSSAAGLFQFTDQTWAAALAQYGAKHGLGPDTPRSDARASALMAGELTQENTRALTAAGVPVNNGTLYLAHFAGAPGAVKLLKADQGLSAADVLPEAAASNKTIFYGPDGAPRTVSAVVARLTAPIIGQASKSDIDFIAKSNSALTKRAEADIDAIVADMAKDILPSEARLNAAFMSAATANDPEVFRKLSVAAGEFQFRREFGRKPTVQEAADIAKLSADASTIGLDQLPARRLQIAQGILQKTRSALSDDGLGYVISANKDTHNFSLTPLSYQNGDALAAGLKERAAIARFGAQQFRTPPLPAMTKDELAEFQSVWQSSDIASRTKLLGTIVAALGPTPDVLNATLAKLGDSQPVLAIAGKIAPSNFGAAQLILGGQQILASDKRFAAPDGGLTGFDDALAKKLPPADFGGNDASAWAGMKEAVKAAYAGLSMRANDVSAKLDEGRLDQAVRTVTGGLVKWRNTMNLPPEYGTTQEDFTRRVTALTDADFDGAQTANGEKITADLVRRRGDFKSLGNGDYLVTFNSGKPNASAAVRADGSAFVLNLSAQRRVSVARPVLANETAVTEDATPDPFSGPVGPLGF